MVDVYRVTAVWQGFQGAPGYSKFSFIGLSDAAKLNGAGAAVRTFFDGFKLYLLNAWTISVQATVQVHEMSNGMLLREEAMTTPPAVLNGTGAGGALYAGGTGAYVTWTTGSVYNGHRVRGRTYLVPLVSSTQSDGTLATAAVTAINAAADALIASQLGYFSVWSKTFSPPPNPTQIGGGISTILGRNVPDKTGILRSRRD
jgi:hypothetical protein